MSVFLASHTSSGLGQTSTFRSRWALPGVGLCLLVLATSCDSRSSGESSQAGGAAGQGATGGATAAGAAGTAGATSGGAAGVGGGAGGGAAGSGGAAGGGNGGWGGTIGYDDDGGTGPVCDLPTTFAWESSGELVGPVDDATHDIVAIKDPTIVFYDDLWHIYATTANSAGSWNMAYLNFAEFDQAPAAPHYYMDQTPGLSGYHCAPQVFFFRPQQKWYLIYQSQPPQYSTADDLADPATWTAPQNVFQTTPQGMPEASLDYWVICDDENCFMFFTGDDGKLYRTQTTLGQFPNGFGTVTVVLQDDQFDLFEGSATYKVRGVDKYLTLVEAIGPTGRYYRAWTATRLDSSWTPLAHTWEAPFAGENNVTFAAGVTDWSNDVSHGELLRDGFDERMTVDACDLQFLYQGRDPASDGWAYAELPYRLGLLSLVP